jgi:hypothetical protein
MLIGSNPLLSLRPRRFENAVTFHVDGEQLYKSANQVGAVVGIHHVPVSSPFLLPPCVSPFTHLWPCVWVSSCLSRSYIHIHAATLLPTCSPPPWQARKTRHSELGNFAIGASPSAHMEIYRRRMVVLLLPSDGAQAPPMQVKPPPSP